MSKVLMREERELVREYGRKLIETGLTTGTGGNISIFNREKGLMAITPSGIDYMDIQAEDIVIMDLKGNTVDGDKLLGYYAKLFPPVLWTLLCVVTSDIML
jgi:L-fuculose-phosphate aldolase